MRVSSPKYILRSCCWLLVHAVKVLGGEFYDSCLTFLWPKAEGIGRSKPGSVNLSGISSINIGVLICPDRFDTEPEHMPLKKQHHQPEAPIFGSIPSSKIPSQVSRTSNGTTPCLEAQALPREAAISSGSYDAWGLAMEPTATLLGKS